MRSFSVLYVLPVTADSRSVKLCFLDADAPQVEAGAGHLNQTAPAGNILVELAGSGTVRVAAAFAWPRQFRAGYRGTRYSSEGRHLLLQFGTMARWTLGRWRRSTHQRFKLLAAGIT